MNVKVHKWCAVPQCINTTKLTPKKLFVYVPHKKPMRDKWLHIARRNPSSIGLNSPIYFCEDHFDLPNDMENYMEYHVMGSVSQVRMKPGCVPTKFECQSEKKKRKFYVLMKQGTILREECDNDEGKSLTTTQEELGETSGSSALNTNMEKTTHTVLDKKNITTSILKHITDKLKSNASQTKIKSGDQIMSNLQPNLCVSASPLKVKKCITPEPFQLTPTCISLSGVMLNPVTEGLSDPGNANSNGAKKPGTSTKKRNHEPKQSSSGCKGIKVFCPKCKTEVSHTAEGIQEDQTKALIAKVFHYFEEEFELLKKMTAKLKLSHLSEFHHRTAQATGVSEATVFEILHEEARRKAAKRYEQPRNAIIQPEVPQNSEVQQEPPLKRRRVCQNPSLTESSNEETDDNVEDIGQSSIHHEIKIESEDEELIVKEELVEYYDGEPEITIGPTNVQGFDNEQAQIDSISVKVEPINDTNDPLAIQPAAAPRRKVPIKFEDTDSASVSTSSRLSPTPSSRSPRRESSARRTRSMGLIDLSEPVPSPSPIPCCHLATPTQAPPGDTLSAKGVAVSAEQTPGGIRCAQHKPAVPLCCDVLERVEALDMSEEEAEELMEEAPWHVRRWVQDLPAPVPAAGAATLCGVDARPSTSGVTAPAPRQDGSDLDSEFDEFDVAEPMPGASRKDIPDADELEEPMRGIVSEIDAGMDDAADRLLGTSPSFTWQSDFESFRGVREQFSGPAPGPLKDYDSPYDAFVDIWDRDIIELIAAETNRYAQQTLDTERSGGKMKPASRLHSWTDTNADEVMLLLAIFMYMAIDPRTSVAEYWTKNEVLELSGFKRLMSYNRYVLLSKFLHFVDNTDVSSRRLPQTGDASSAGLSAKLDKLAPILEHLEKKFKSLYNLGPDVSIDESLTSFKGRLSWVLTIRSKAARFGIKSYELCESNTGYMAGFQIYTGKSDAPTSQPSLGVHLGEESTKAVLELLQGLKHRGHCVVMDNFYNCPSLARYLKSLGFDCLGTLRSCRRNVPSDIAKVPKHVSKGTIISRHCGDVSIIAWMDSKMVNIISTYHRPDTYVGSKAGKTLVKPVCVRDYNESMGGVDLKDQKLSTYLLERKRGVKWYLQMFKRLLNVSIHNALVMYLSSLKRRNKLPVTHREFRYQLAGALVKRHSVCPPERSRAVPELKRLRHDILHEPEHLKGQQFRRRCVVCYRRKETKMIHTKCAQCDVYLCFVDCWRIWHSAAQLPGKDVREWKKRRS